MEPFLRGFFYLLFPVLVVPISMLYRKLGWSALALLWLASLLPVLVFKMIWPAMPLSGEEANVPLEIVKFMPLLRLPEFCAGMWAGAYFLEKGEFKHAGRYGLIALGFILMATCWWPQGVFPVYFNLILVPAFVLLLLAVVSRQNSFLGHPVLVFMGEASYSLYLLHEGIYGYLAGYSKHFHPEWRQMAWFNLSYIVVAVLVSSTAYLYIEKPMRRWIRGFTQKSNLRIITP